MPDLFRWATPIKLLSTFSPEAHSNISLTIWKNLCLPKERNKAKNKLN